MKKIALSTAAVALLTATAATAEMRAQAATDLNLRMGPGPQFNVETVIAAQDEVAVEGCIEDRSWCKVDYNGTTGWAYAAYLTAPKGETVVVLNDAQITKEVTTVVVENPSDEAALVGGVGGAAVGALIGGPLVIAGAAIAGAAAADAATPDTRVITYVESNPVDTVIMDGEVVVGAGIPEGVVFHEIPDSSYSYMSINGQPVIIEPADRKIVAIVR